MSGHAHGAIPAPHHSAAPSICMCREVLSRSLAEEEQIYSLRWRGAQVMTSSTRRIISAASAALTSDCRAIANGHISRRQDKCNSIF